MSSFTGSTLPLKRAARSARRAGSREGVDLGGAARGQRLDEGVADPAIGTGDQHDFPGDLHGSAPPLGLSTGLLDVGGDGVAVDLEIADPAPDDLHRLPLLGPPAR
jgi:hypothetical protein